MSVKERSYEDIQNPTVRAWIKEYRESSWGETDDPVADLVRDLPAKHIVAWLVWYKGLPEEAAENVESNLRRSLCSYRFQGRLDRSPFLVALAKLLGVYRDIKTLKAPPTPAAVPTQHAGGDGKSEQIEAGDEGAQQ